MSKRQWHQKCWDSEICWMKTILSGLRVFDIIYLVLYREKSLWRVIQIFLLNDITSLEEGFWCLFFSRKELNAKLIWIPQHCGRNAVGTHTTILLSLLPTRNYLKICPLFVKRAMRFPFSFTQRFLRGTVLRVVMTISIPSKSETKFTYKALKCVS